MDRGTLWATVHGVTKSWTRLSDWAGAQDKGCFQCWTSPSRTSSDFPGSSGVKTPCFQCRGRGKGLVLDWRTRIPKVKKKKKVECVLPNMFLLVCWTSGFLGQVVPCWKLSALLARPFRSKELYALLQKWLTSFSVEFSIFPSAG